MMRLPWQRLLPSNGALNICSHGRLEAERVNQCWWNLVRNSKLGPQWQSWDQILKFLKFKCRTVVVGKYSKCHNSPANGPIGTQLQFFFKFEMAAAAILKIAFLAINHRLIVRFQRNFVWGSRTAYNATARPDWLHGTEALFSSCPFVCSSVTKLGKTWFCKQISDITLMQISTSGPRGKGIKQSTLGVRRSKIKVIYKVEGLFGGLTEASTEASVILDPFESSSFSSSRLVLYVLNTHFQLFTISEFCVPYNCK